MSQKIFVLERVYKTLTDKIETISDPQQQEYYDKIYKMLVNHFMAYRIMSTGMFETSLRTFNKTDKAMKYVSLGKCILQKIPVLGSLLEIPFQIMEEYRGIKTEHLNDRITGNITDSDFATEARINQFMAYVIESLMDHTRFNKELVKALKSEEESYINKAEKMISNAKDFIYSRFFGSSQNQYSFVDKLVVMHMTLVTKSLYEVESEEFKKLSKNKKAFFEFILKVIQPDQL